MSSERQPLQENPRDSTTESPTSTSSSPKTKKLKKTNDTSCKILTFSLSHSPVQVQLLDSHSLYDLVDIICQETTVGMNESVYQHMWDVYVPGISGCFNSSEEYVASGFVDDNEDGPLRMAKQASLKSINLAEKTVLALKYDYGSPSEYLITLVAMNDFSTQDDVNAFPRAKPVQLPSGVQEFTTTDTGIDLNAMFPTLNSFLQQANMLTINLFQPGRKKNYGYLERGNDGVKHMIYLPAPPNKKELSDYLHLLNHTWQFKYSTQDGGTYPNYTWYSVVAFPSDYNKSFGKYGENLRPGFCDMVIATPNTQSSSGVLNAVFPKVAALAGCKKDKLVPKGWITYKNSLLRICSGSSKTVKCKAPPGTAFHGEDQHEPDDSTQGILFQAKIEIQSLHHLLCFVEGFLRTL